VLILTKYRYSKSISHYSSTHSDYFDENAKLLTQALSENNIYSSQDKRLQCKICRSELQKNHFDLSQFGISYVFCTNCSHLNGIYEDTIDFVDSIYCKNTDGESYNQLLQVGNFVERSNDVYLPKAEFLLSHLDHSNLSVLDVGCGCGNFVFSLIKLGAKARGIDLSKASIDFGNHHITLNLGKSAFLTRCEEYEFCKQIEECDESVISVIGVIEHLREPHKFFDSFKKSNAKYLYYSVPMFSASAIFENIFPTIFPRQLSGAHTHLFTESSIVQMNSLCGVKSIAEWRFGTDIMDLYRSISIMGIASGISPKAFEFFESGFGSKLNEFQEILDKNHFCSEIHVIAEKQ